MPTFEETVGARIKDTRKKIGMSQEVLAERSGYDSGYISQIERGIRRPSLKALTRIADALSIPVACLLEREGHETGSEQKDLLLREIGELLKGREVADMVLALDIVKAVIRRLDIQNPKRTPILNEPSPDQ